MAEGQTGWWMGAMGQSNEFQALLVVDQPKIKPQTSQNGSKLANHGSQKGAYKGTPEPK